MGIKMKRFLSLVLTIALVVSILPAHAASEFSDLEGHWAKEVMLKANENGLLFGSNGKMDPNGKLTRAHIAAIVTRAFGATYEADMSTYTDVPADAWYAQPIARAVGMGIMANRGMIKPNEEITRQETFLILAAALNLDDADAASLDMFSDAGQVSEYARGQLAAMAAKGYIKGANGKLEPNKTITRAEFAALFSQIFTTIVSSGTLSSGIVGNVLVNGNGVRMDYCTIEGDLIIADGASAVSLNAVSVYGRILVRGGAERVEFAASTNATEGIFVNNRHAEAKLANASSMATSGVVVKTPTGFTGNFTNVKIEEVAVNVTVASGVIGRLEANAENITVTNEQGGITSYVYANAKDLTLIGSGFSSVIIADGVTGVTINGNPLLSTVVSNALAGYYG